MSIAGIAYAESQARLTNLKNGSKTPLDSQILLDLRILTNSYFLLKQPVCKAEQPIHIPEQDVNFALLARHWLSSGTFNQIAHLAFSAVPFCKIQESWDCLGAALTTQFARERISIALTALNADGLYVNHETLFRPEPT